MRLHSQSTHLMVDAEPDPHVTVTGDHVIVDLDGDVDLTLEFTSHAAAWDWFAAHLIALHDTEAARETRPIPASFPGAFQAAT